MEELQNKVISLQQENSGLSEKLAKCRERLDFQEQSLSLTKDEREELMQVKVCIWPQLTPKFIENFSSAR